MARSNEARDNQLGNIQGKQNLYDAYQSEQDARSSARSSAEAARSSAIAAGAVETTAETDSETTGVLDKSTATPTSIGLGGGITTTMDQSASTSTQTAVVSTTNTGDSSGHNTGSSTFESTASSALARTATATHTTFYPSTPAPGTSDASSLAASTATSLHGSQWANFTATSGIGAASGGSNLLPITNNAHHQGMSRSAMTAAIVVPVMFAIFAGTLAFLCLRRRQQKSKDGASLLFPAMMEKLSAMPSDSSKASAAPAAPVVTSNHNNTYFTGLDVSSLGSERGESGEYYAPARRSEGGTFVDPPPPYKAESLASTRSGGSLEVPPTTAVPAPRAPSMHEASPFNDPPSPTRTITPTAAASGLLVLPLERPPNSRSTTNRSFDSDMYSDNASMYSAQAARMNTGGQQVIAASGDGNPLGHPDNPFSNIEEWHSLTGNNAPK